MKTLSGYRCPACGRPLTYFLLGHVEAGAEVVAGIPEPGELAMCIRCVALVLCKAAVAIHGDLGDEPESHNFSGHEQRMRDHEDRIRGMDLASGVNEMDEELVETVARA